VSYKNCNSVRRHYIKQGKSLHTVKCKLKESRKAKYLATRLRLAESEREVDYYKRLIAYYAKNGLFGGVHWYNAKSNLMLYAQQVKDLSHALGHD